MSDRRYAVWDSTLGIYLSSIPDDLLEEAARAIDIMFEGDGSSARLWLNEARAALGVLFGEEE